MRKENMIEPQDPQCVQTSVMTSALSEVYNMDCVETTLQQLIKKLEEKRDMFKPDGNVSERRSRGAYVDAIIIAKGLLADEKLEHKNIVTESFDQGFNCPVSACNGEEYYYNVFCNKVV